MRCYQTVFSSETYRSLNVNGIDAHPIEDAIVVTYDLEASLVGDLGHTVLETGSKECQKM